MAIRIYIIEDHAVMRRALVDFLEDLPDFEVQGAASTAEDALDALNDTPVDLVLVDTRLPGISGIELVGELTRRHPELRCVMLSGHGERIYVDRAMEAGAQGYVLKGNPDEIPEAIRRAQAGDVYLSTQLRYEH